MDRLGAYIRECEMDREVDEVVQANLTRCEFQPERYWSRTDAAIGVILSLGIGYFVGREK